MKLKSDLPPVMPNRRKFTDKLKSGQQFEPKINRELFEFVFGSTGLKINFAKESFQRLRELEKYLELLAKDIVNGKTEKTPNERKYFDFLCELDFFIFELYGSLDFFSREINFVLELGLKEQECNLFRINEVVENDTIKNVIGEMLNSEWFDYFHKLRIRITHRLAIVLSSRNNEFFFPDNPLSTFPKNNLKKIKVIPNCQLWLEKSLTYVDEISGFLGMRIFSNW